MVYKCKICGGQATVDTQNGIAICEYCGTKQALPLFSEDSERLLYESGNNYLLHSEYDKAENVFNQLLTIKPNAAELYWDLVLCKYGVTYVKDPKTGKYIPTCNRTHYTPIFLDENYKKAIELSSGEKKALFEDDAKTIDNIQKGIIAVSKKEKPFDIFISYKETDGNGNRTKDSVEAQKLYEKLTEAGYKVFFSRITLEDKIGTEYEPYIYAALYSSKVMITVCSSRENIEAVWVKNEWSRYLGFRQKDSTKTVLPLYFDMAKEELPDEFALLSAYDMTVDGFEEELLRGIKKLIPLPIMKAKRRKQILKATGITVASLVVVLGIASAIIIPKELKQRRLETENAAKEQAYQSAMTLFENGDYIAASEAFNALGDYKDSTQMVTTSLNEKLYVMAKDLFENKDYASAADTFTKLGDYKDSAQMAETSTNENAYLSAMALFENGDYVSAEEAFANLGEYKDSAHMAVRCPIQPQYDAAMQLYYDGKYAQSAWAFGALGDYEDAKEQKTKAELSWRKSYANIAMRMGETVYCISPNGSIEGFEINEHGKVISICVYEARLDTLISGALYEDGTLIMKNGKQYTDVAQALQLVEYLVILKTDGTVIMNDKPIEKWKNIVGISGDGFQEYSTYKISISATDIDGNLYEYYDEPYYYKEAVYTMTSFDKRDHLENTEYLDKYDRFILHKNGTLYVEGSKKPVLNDVVSFVDFGCVITKSGTLYLLDSYENKATKINNSYGCVYDEWLARLE